MFNGKPCEGELHARFGEGPPYGGLLRTVGFVVRGGGSIGRFVLSSEGGWYPPGRAGTPIPCVQLSWIRLTGGSPVEVAAKRPRS